MADAVLGQIFDWIYGKLVGFFSEFFEMMNMMGADLFDLPWTQAVVLFFSRFAWMLYAVGLVVAGFETPSSPNRRAATCTALRSMGSKASWP